MFTLPHAIRKWLILLAMSSALGLVFLNQTELAIALPVIQRDLNLSNTLLLWVINAYLLALSALVLLAGKIGDSLGHKRVFLAGMTIFTVASILGALAQSGASLIAARCLQGIGGAFIMAAAGAVVVDSFSKEERGKALGIYAGFGSLFLVLGPLIGGAITQYFGWSAIFWINIPIAIINITLAAYVLPSWESATKLIFDYCGIVLSVAFINGFILYFMEAPRLGWISPISVALFFFSTLSAITFVLWERRCAHPLLDITLFKTPHFAIILILLITVQGLSILYVFWAIFLQKVFHYSPLSAGLHLLPAMAPIALISPIGGHLCDRYGHILPMAWGCFVTSLGFCWIGFSIHYLLYLGLIPGFVMFGVGVALFFSAAITALMSMVDNQHRGVAAAVISGARTFGNSISLSIFGGFLNSLNTSKLTAMIDPASGWLTQIPKNAIEELLAKSSVNSNTVSHLPSSSVTQLKTIALKAYTDAFSIIMFLAAVVAFVCLLIIFKISRWKLSQ